MNKHIIHGRLARDPSFTPSTNDKGSDRVNFTVATDRRFGDETDFFDCVVFGKRAEVINKFFIKGQEILIFGEGQIRSYEGKDGVKRKSYSVLVEDFDFCGSKSNGSTSAPKQEETKAEQWTEQEGDIPF